jgi:PKD repeat protein
VIILGRAPAAFAITEVRFAHDNVQYTCNALPANSPTYYSTEHFVTAIVVVGGSTGNVQIDWIQPDGSVVVGYPGTLPNQSCWAHNFQIAESYPPRPTGTWMFRVTLSGGQVFNAQFTILAGSPPQPPNPPTNVAVTPYGDDMKIMWTGASNATGYTIERKSPTSNYQQIAQPGTTNSEYHDHVALSNTTYCYRMRSFNNTSYSEYTGEVCAVYLVPPTLLQPGNGASLTGGSVTFEWSSSAGATGYKLRVGSSCGSGSTIDTNTPNPSYATSLSAGSYVWQAQAVSSSPIGASGVSECRSLTVSAAPSAPVASFTSAPRNPFVGDIVNFTDASTGNPTSWQWNFGDGGSSTTRNPTHVFGSAGRFHVTLTAANSGGQNATAKDIDVAATVLAPIADFSFSPESPTTGTIVQFTDRSTGGTPTTWSWDFGDGGGGSGATATHTFQNAGTYAAKLTVGNSAGSDQKTRNVVVTVPPPAGPTALFTWTPQYPASGKPVSFTDQSTGSPTLWEWSFGDGGTSSSRNPSHTFASAGSYTVVLTARNTGGSSVESNRITVGDPPSAVSFGLDTTAPRAETRVRFTGSATGSVESWLWNFGDDTTGVGNPVDHTFARAGEFVVRTTGRNRYGEAGASSRINVAAAVLPLVVGDRVAATVDLAGSNASIRRGDTGTLVCTAQVPGYNAFVNWDKPVEHGHAGFSPCAGTAYDGFGWGVQMWQLERSNSPKPQPPVCAPGKQETRGCTFSADCAGLQTRICNADGRGWGEWKECGIYSVCLTDMPTVTSSKDGYFTIHKLDMEKGVPEWIPVTYSYHAEISAVLGRRRDPATGVETIVLRRLDQVFRAKPLTGFFGDLCKARKGIESALYDDSRYVATIYIAKEGQFVVPPGWSVLGGWTDTSYSATKPMLKVRLSVAPDTNGYTPECSTTWSADWQVRLY